MLHRGRLAWSGARGRRSGGPLSGSFAPTDLCSRVTCSPVKAGAWGTAARRECSLRSTPQTLDPWKWRLLTLPTFGAYRGDTSSVRPVHEPRAPTELSLRRLPAATTLPSMHGRSVLAFLLAL